MKTKDILKDKLVLDLNKLDCHVYDLMSENPQKYYTYIQPIYTKINSIYGYITVNKDKVFFIYSDDYDSICCDDVSDKFNVEYVLNEEEIDL